MRYSDRQYFIPTFDLEKFTLFQDFNHHISEEEINKISLGGAQKIIKLLNSLKIRATFFVETEMARDYQEILKRIRLDGHEIALHYEIGKKSGETVIDCKRQLEKISGSRVVGFRTHQLKPYPSHELKKAGFLYNSSFHPTFVPGRYCHLWKTTSIFQENGLYCIPISVVPAVRIPFSWLWFRNFGLSYAKFCTTITYLKKEMVNLYFHNWDFEDLAALPANNGLKIIVRNCGEKCADLFSKYIHWLSKKKVIVLPFRDYLQDYSSRTNK